MAFLAVADGAVLAGIPLVVLAASPPAPAFMAKHVRFVIVDPTAHYPRGSASHGPYYWNHKSNITLLGLVDSDTLVLQSAGTIRKLYGSLGNPDAAIEDDRPSAINMTELFDVQQVQERLARSSA